MKRNGVVIIWEFRVRQKKRRAFEKSYGPDGVWARFFRGGKGYIRTELVRDLKTPGRYLTLDYWTSKAAYEKFTATHVTKYKELDRECEPLTRRETRIGLFA